MNKLILLLFILTGCATALTEDERQLQHAIDRENWELCQIAYRQSNEIMISYHDHKRGPHKNHEVRADLRDNSCRLVLGETYWITQ